MHTGGSGGFTEVKVDVKIGAKCLVSSAAGFVVIRWFLAYLRVCTFPNLKFTLNLKLEQSNRIVVGGESDNGAITLLS